MEIFGILVLFAAKKGITSKPMRAPLCERQTRCT